MARNTDRRDDTEPPVRISTEEAATRSGCSNRTIRRLIARGTLPAYRIAGTSLVRLNVADVDALFQPVPHARMFDNLDDTAS